MDTSLLAGLVGAPNDLPPAEWEHLYDLAVASGATLLLEVGRGYGNSTVVLTEAAHQLNAQVISVGFDEPPAFETVTWPKLQPVLGDRWRDRLEVVQADIRDYTPPTNHGDVFVFWDAHGPDVANTMLHRIIPALQPTVAVHDIRGLGESVFATVPDAALFGWRDLRSPYVELPMIGDWLDQHRHRWEQGTCMLSFSLNPGRHVAWPDQHGYTSRFA